MNELSNRNFVLQEAKKYLGRKESNGSHKEIIDVYNNFKPLPRGYKVKYTDAWCATFISAVAIKCGYTNIIPIECGCEEMVILANKKGIWQNNNHKPMLGDIILYDWDKNGRSDHIGFIDWVNGTTLNVLEGNFNNSVGYRNISVLSDQIRGYITPNYKEVCENVSRETNKINEHMEHLQQAILDSYQIYVPISGVFDLETQSALKQINIRKNNINYVVGWIQCRLNIFSHANLVIDDNFGSKTEKAVKNYQKDKGLAVDGIVGINTFKNILRQCNVDC